MRRSLGIFQADGRDIKGHGVEAHPQFEASLVLRILSKQGADTGRQRPVQPADGLAIRVEPRFKTIDGVGVEIGMLDVIFPGPLNAHGTPFELAGNAGRFHDKVRLGFTAKAATKQGDVDGDILNIQSQLPGNTLAGGAGCCTGAQASPLPSLKRTTATGGSMGAWAIWGM